MMYGIERITSKEASEIIENRERLGLFFMIEKNLIIGIDNSDGNAWTEEFGSLEECRKWLNGEEAVDRFGIVL